MPIREHIVRQWCKQHWEFEPKLRSPHMCLHLHSVWVLLLLLLHLRHHRWYHNFCLVAIINVTFKFIMKRLTAWLIPILIFYCSVVFVWYHIFSCFCCQDLGVLHFMKWHPIVLRVCRKCGFSHDPAENADFQLAWFAHSKITLLEYPVP